MLTSFFILLIGFAAGFLDSSVGSGGLVSIPMLIFMGFPPQVAIATDRFGSVGSSIGSILKFWNTKKIQWKYVSIFSLFALVGAYIGTQILFVVDPKILQKIIGVILIFVLPFIFIKKELGVHKSIVTMPKKLIGCVIYFVIMVYNGFFGTGAGPLSLYNSVLFFGFTFIEANATNSIAWFFLALFSLVIFAQHNVIDYINGAILLIGMIAGGYIGAHALLKIGDVWVKRLFIAVVIISAVKLLIF